MERVINLELDGFEVIDTKDATAVCGGSCTALIILGGALVIAGIIANRYLD